MAPAVEAASQTVASDGGTALAEGTVADIAVPGEPAESTPEPPDRRVPGRGDEQQRPPAASAGSAASGPSPYAPTSASGAGGISSGVIGTRAGLGASGEWIAVCGAVDPAACAAFRPAIAVADHRAAEQRTHGQLAVARLRQR